MNFRYIFLLGLFFSTCGKALAQAPNSAISMQRLEKRIAELDQEEKAGFLKTLFGPLITSDDFIYLGGDQLERLFKDLFLEKKPMPGQKDTLEKLIKWVVGCVKADEKELKISSLLCPNITSGTSPKDIVMRFLINAAIKEGLDKFLQSNNIQDDFLKKAPGAQYLFSPASRILVARFLRLDKILNAIPFGNLIAEKIRPIPMHKASHFASVAECLFDTFQKTNALSTVAVVGASFAPKYIGNCLAKKFNPIESLSTEEKNDLQSLKNEFIKIFMIRAAIKAGVIVGCHLADKTIIKIKKARAARIRNKKIKQIINSCA